MKIRQDRKISFLFKHATWIKMILTVIRSSYNYIVCMCMCMWMWMCMCACFKASAEMSSSCWFDEALVFFMGPCGSGSRGEDRMWTLGSLKSATRPAVQQLQWSVASLAAVKVFLPQSCLFAQFHWLSVLTKQHRNIHTRHAIVRAHACTRARARGRRTQTRTVIDTCSVLQRFSFLW